MQIKMRYNLLPTKEPPHPAKSKLRYYSMLVTKLVPTGLLEMAACMHRAKNQRCGQDFVQR